MPYTHFMLAEDDLDDQVFFQEAVWEISPSVKITIAGNGKELLAQLKNGLPDLIFSDIHMPYVSGVDLLRSLKLFGFHPPVIILSSSFGERQLCLELGAAAFLLKPINQQHFKAEIERTLSVV